METGFTGCNGVFGKAQGLRYSKLCLNPDILTKLKEPEHQEKYISLPAKTEEMVQKRKILVDGSAMLLTPPPRACLIFSGI